VELSRFPVRRMLLCSQLLPMAASTLSPCAELVFPRQVPRAQVAVSKNSAFDLMTQSAFIARAPAELKQLTIHRDARNLRKSVGPLRSAVRPKTTTTPASGPGHKVRAVSDAATSRHRSGIPRSLGVQVPSLSLSSTMADHADERRNLPPVPRETVSLNPSDSRRTESQPTFSQVSFLARKLGISLAS